LADRIGIKNPLSSSKLLNPYYRIVVYFITESFVLLFTSSINSFRFFTIQTYLLNLLFVICFKRMQTLIKNGLIINHDKTFSSDILIRDNKIMLIGHNFQKDVRTNREIDASGCLIFPGGIDPHVHLGLQTPLGKTCDNFTDGGKAALMGGTTTVIDFVTPERGMSMIYAFNQRKYDANRSPVDFKLHISPVEWDRRTFEEIVKCWNEEGVQSFKVYMAYKSSIGLNDAAIFKVMQTVGRIGGIVAIHCETGGLIDELRNDFVNRGELSLQYHALSRPAHTEANAVKRAIELAYQAECPIYIVHVSAKESLEHIRAAQARMQPVYAETCPHYLLFDDSKYLGDFETCSPFVMCPPLRSRGDVESLWQALADGTLQTVGTDHCSFTMQQKLNGGNDFRKIPSGVGGIEHRLELMYTFGVLERRLNINRFVELVSTNAARIFGMFPKKGIIAKGAEADIVVWDPNAERTISANTHSSSSDHSIYEGIKTKGKVKYLVAKGKLVIDNGILAGLPRGSYLI
jgi:dihydropyrimidinase